MPHWTIENIDPAWLNYSRWKNWTPNEFGRFSLQEAAYFDAEFGPLLRGVDSPQVLEIGFGNGKFLGWALDSNFDYTGIEIIPELVHRAEQLGVTVYNTIHGPAFQLLTERFDCVVALDVLEHIEQAQLPGLFEMVTRLLKSDGYFISRFPNGDSPFGRVYQHGDLTHQTTLGRLKIAQLANMAGLTVVSVGAPVIPKSGLRLTKRILVGLGLMARSILEYVIAHLYYSGMRVAFAPNLVAILQKRC